MRDAAQFEDEALDLLLAREAENCLMIGLTSQLRSGAATLTASSPYFALIRSQEKVVGAALIAGYVLVLSHPIDPAALLLIAADVAEAAPDVPGVVSEKGASRSFAEAWTALTGKAHRVNLSERIFQCERVVSPRAVSGAMSIAGEPDRGLLARWLGAFAQEALGQSSDAAANDRFATRWTQRQGRTMYLWIDEGRVVSMVGVSGDTPNGIRVAPVYTPPELRGRGYASALTAAVTQTQFDAGKRYCFLYTDLANPTSNHIYQSVGYRPVIDAAQYLFDVPLARSSA